MFKTIKQHFLRNSFIAAMTLVTCLSLVIITIRQNQTPQQSTNNYQSENNIKAENENGKSSTDLQADYKTSLITDDSDSSKSVPYATQQIYEQRKAKAFENYGQLPLHFEPNNGQIDNQQVRFSSRGQGYNLFLSPTKATLALRQAVNDKTKQQKKEKTDLISQTKSQRVKADKREYKQAVVEMQIVGANKHSESIGTDELEGKSNYFIGNDKSKWRTDVANYKRVRFEEVYSGINLEYYGNQRQLEYDFIVAPNADASQIKLKFTGIKKVKVEKQSGELILKTSLGEVRQKKPYVYQTDETGNKLEIASRYRIKGKQVSFEIGEYNKNKQLVIDPVVLVYSSFFGGSDFDSGTSIKLDNQGNVYVAGYTQSFNNFPEVNPINRTPPQTLGGGDDAFISKFNPAGQLVYSTRLGGSDKEYEIGSPALTVDALGSVYVVGNTRSRDFPTTTGALQENHAIEEPGGEAGQEAKTDGFITKLNATGNQLVYSTYLGGNRLDYLRGIKVDAEGNAYIVGHGDSTNMPATNGVLQKERSPNNCSLRPPADFIHLNCDDVYIGKLNPAGSHLVYFTYLGGYANDFGTGIAIDSSNNVYITGGTVSQGGANGHPAQFNDFPTENPIQGEYGRGGSDAILTKINPDATKIIYSTYHGGSAYDTAYDIALDGNNNVYIAGVSFSPEVVGENNTFPIVGGIQANYGGGAFDGIVTKFNSTGSAILYSTFLGGSGADQARSIAVDNTGNAYITGDTNSPNFPILEARQPIIGGTIDAYVTKLNTDGNRILYSTYHGGSNIDIGRRIAVDNAGNAYITGLTHSNINFPILNPRQATFGGFYDAFIAKFSDPPLQLYTIVGKVVNSNGSGAAGITINLTGAIVAQRITDANGLYVFHDLPAGGTYTITPFLSSVVFASPVSRTYPNLSSNFTNQNFNSSSFNICSYSLSSTEVISPATTTNGNFNVNTTPHCTRTAISDASWLVITSGANGIGSGPVSYVVQPNYGPSRSATISVNGKNFVVTQNGQAARNVANNAELCAINFNKSRVVVPAVTPAGELYKFTIITQSDCEWSAARNDSVPSGSGASSSAPNNTWLNVNPSSATGKGTKEVIFSVAELTGNIPRSAEIVVNGKIFVVIQALKSPPSFSINISPNNSPDFPFIGGDGNLTINVSAANGKWVTQIPSERDKWIVLPPSGNSGGGSQVPEIAKYTVQANQGTEKRIGTIIIGDKDYTVTQNAGQSGECNYQLSSPSQTVEASTGATGSFTVSAGDGCSFQAIENIPWLDITEGSGTGSGTIRFRTTETNSGSNARAGTITIGNKTLDVTQNTTQQACSYTIDQNFRNISDKGEAGIVKVSTTQGCNWTAVRNNDNDWINVNSGATGSGSGEISFIAQSNNTSTVRKGTITIAEQIFTLNQAAKNDTGTNTPETNTARSPYDFDGDGKTDLSIFRPGPGEWWYLRSSDGGNRAFQFGSSSDKLVPADYTGDGKTDIAFFRPSTSEWFILRSEDNSFYSFPFGASGDVPAPADYDGDGKADAAIYRPSNQTWFILRSSGGVTIEAFGISGDVPVTADYDGDNKSDLAIYRPNAGQWWLLRSSQGIIVYQFGSPTDKLVQGDYTGDGKTDVAFFRPQTNEWFILRSENNSFYSFPFGASGDVPSPGDYDGDGKADAAIFRPSSNTWFAQRSTSGTLIQGFGIAGDKPIPNAFIP